MQTIKINYCGFWNSFKEKDNFFYHILSRRFNVEISDDPDFVICSNRGKPFEYMKYDCVRIMFMGENLSPDFTVFDYVIGFDFLDFGDRYFRLPFAAYSDDGKPRKVTPLDRSAARDLLKEKKYFCNFIYGHPSSNGMREKLFEALNSYKPVVSPGSYLNNTGGGKKRCSWAEKHDYLRLSKFTIAGDSIRYPGFVTEKIVDPFIFHSIPVYFGSTKIYDDFNKDAFICCENENDIERVVEEVRLLDCDDEAYIEMLTRHPLPTENYWNEMYANVERFLINIFSQDRKYAYRRVRHFCAEQHESYLKDYMRKYERTPEFIRKIKNKLS